MKITLTALVLATAILVPLYPVYAEDSNPNTHGLIKLPPTTRLADEKINTSSLSGRPRPPFNLQAFNTMVASREANLKLKLEKFRDKEEADLVQRINDLFNQINKRTTDRYNKQLDTLTSILNRLQSKVASDSASIHSASASAAIASASAAIQTARDAVTTQSEKDYTINISTESATKKDVMTTRNQLYNDLKGVEKLMREAVKSVSSAIRISHSNGEDNQ